MIFWIFLKLKKMIKLVFELLEGKEQKVEKREFLKIDEGIRYMGGNEQLYRNVLKTYAQENKNVSETLAALIENKDYHEAALRIHKIKSSSGSIGARDLFQTASQFQKTLERNDTAVIEADFKKFCIQINGVLSAIEDYLKTAF
ncbi:MAG: two-component system, sensor histidine kinase and response regulator [Eubacteriaceae bacterium]|nr:two-component system, sensor histidine kinase and response regulator [Eubacteriaceae bacterium]MDK2962129.1 two-component system, sensor histidine kinase and response regulator [Eubacteriaceae bacterium]